MSLTHCFGNREGGAKEKREGDKAETCGLNGMSLSEAVKDRGARYVSL